LPGLSIVFSAYNEAQVIQEKIQNALAIDYPQNLIEIIVVSDASTDLTNEIVGRFENRGVQLIVNSERKGKTYGLNRAVEVAKNPILVFTDSNAMFEPNALSFLGRYFDDPTVGLVTGSTKYFSRNESDQIVKNIDSYTKLERWIKVNESRIGSCVGADGAIFAMRRDLYRPLANTDINDFVLPLAVVRQGFRAIFDSEAFCLEEHAVNTTGEYQRQIRIATRTIHALIRHADLFNFFRYGGYSWMLASHKLLRFVFPWVALAFIAVNISLIPAPPYIYKASLISILILLCLSFLCRIIDIKVLSFLMSFFDLNLAILAGWIKLFKRQTFVTWGGSEKN
jgi:cellulose synthase/poly-beta-1,6-N-acetylglucosamine synthase-like glycosyltransferase